MITCVITSPSKTVSYGNVQNIMLPALSGEMQILLGHAEAFVLLRKGDVLLQYKNKQGDIFQIDGGECHIKDDLVTIIL